MSAAGDAPAFEVWRSVVGDDRYEVSSAGRVRNARTLHVLRPQPCGRTSAYLKVNLAERAEIEAQLEGQGW